MYYLNCVTVCVCVLCVCVCTYKKSTDLLENVLQTFYLFNNYILKLPNSFYGLMLYDKFTNNKSAS